ncbi:hypothetical protein [Burkholderia ambifaria]|uniref:hypothetical protein n=1 Tax=Burkholderia ambifaria TaxID=152480 RepID=UPI000F7FDDC7|nr:hypothetical protein [Burkholderia ambifaria]
MTTNSTNAAKVGAVVGACAIGLAILYVYSANRSTQEDPAPAVRAAANGADDAKWEREQLAAVETVADRALKDPGSAQYRNVKVFPGQYACGEVNARNSLGGYMGYSDFFVVIVTSDGVNIDPTQSKAYVRQPDMADVVWGRMLPDTCLNYWADQRGMDWLKRARGL